MNNCKHVFALIIKILKIYFKGHIEFLLCENTGSQLRRQSGPLSEDITNNYSFERVPHFEFILNSFICKNRQCSAPLPPLCHALSHSCYTLKVINLSVMRIAAVDSAPALPLSRSCRTPHCPANHGPQSADEYLPGGLMGLSLRPHVTE